MKMGLLEFRSIDAKFSDGTNDWNLIGTLQLDGRPHKFEYIDDHQILTSDYVLELARANGLDLHLLFSLLCRYFSGKARDFCDPSPWCGDYTAIIKDGCITEIQRRN
jgi:hypothetical protein